MQIHAYGNNSFSPFKVSNNAHVHKSVGRHNPRGGRGELTDAGNVSSDLGTTHIGIRNPADLPSVKGIPHGS